MQFERLKRKSVFAFQSFNIQQGIVVTCSYRHLLRLQLLHPQKRQTSSRVFAKISGIYISVLSSPPFVEYKISFPGQNPR